MYIPCFTLWTFFLLQTRMLLRTAQKRLIKLLWSQITLFLDFYFCSTPTVTCSLKSPPTHTHFLCENITMPCIKITYSIVNIVKILDYKQNYILTINIKYYFLYMMITQKARKCHYLTPYKNKMFCSLNNLNYFR